MSGDPADHRPARGQLSYPVEPTAREVSDRMERTLRSMASRCDRMEIGILRATAALADIDLRRVRKALETAEEAAELRLAEERLRLHREYGRRMGLEQGPQDDGNQEGSGGEEVVP
jgi:hypothetical protein